MIVHILYAEADKTLCGCARFLSDPSLTVEQMLQVMLKTRHLHKQDGRRSAHPVVAEAARELLNKSENERSGVRSTALSFLSLYRDPVVAAITSASDWKISDLVDGARPVSLYFVVPPFDLSWTRPLVRLILNQIEKAYGPNNAILYNCRMRISCAANDERTARHLSEALGTKTQLRSQRNYTGHRLAPWLSYMMVSRQEIQRA